VVSNGFKSLTSTAATLTVVSKLPPIYTLLGFWPLDESTGIATQDLSWNGHGGTLYNGPTRRPGRVAGAIEFDGMADRFVDLQAELGAFENDGLLSFRTHGGLVQRRGLFGNLRCVAY